MSRATRAATELMNRERSEDQEDSSSHSSSPEKEPLRRYTIATVHSTRGQTSASCGFAFVDGQVFQACIGIIIVLSVLTLSAETDHPGWAGWCILDNLFLLTFLIEVVLRVMAKGIAFLCNRRDWMFNLLDATLVCVGILETWVLPWFLTHEDAADVWKVTIRVLRLMRLLRLMRVFAMVRTLASFIDAIAGMMGPFSMIITILFGFNLFVSIILTHLLGHGDAIEDHIFNSQFYEQQVRVHFRDVTTSFFTLFQIITTDNWYKIAEPLIHLDSRWRFFFVFFIAFFSWTMISVLTAVASDNVISATSDKREKELLEQERRHKEFMRLLREMFHEADEDGNGLLDKTEFKAMLETDNLHQVLQTLEIPVRKEDLERTWDMLDVNETHVLTIDEFVDGLAFLNEDVPSTRHIVDIDYGMRRFWAKLELRIQLLRGAVMETRMRNEALLDSMRKQEEVHWQQGMALWLWREWALREDPNSFPAELRRLAAQEAQAGLPQILAGRPPPLGGGKLSLTMTSQWSITAESDVGRRLSEASAYGPEVQADRVPIPISHESTRSADGPVSDLHPGGSDQTAASLGRTSPDSQH